MNEGHGFVTTSKVAGLLGDGGFDKGLVWGKLTAVGLGLEK